MPPVFAHGRLRLYLLKLLDEAPRHGYEVIRLLEERFHGLYAPSAGTVYPRLAKLEAEGLVTHTTEGGRKVYAITDAGRAELAGRSGELADLELEIRESVAELAAEIRDGVQGAAGDLRREMRAAAKEALSSEGAEGWHQTKEEFKRAKQGWKEQARRAKDESRRAREEAQRARRQARDAQEQAHAQARQAQAEAQRIVRHVQEQVQDHFARGDWPTGVREGLTELAKEFGDFGTRLGKDFGKGFGTRTDAGTGHAGTAPTGDAPTGKEPTGSEPTFSVAREDLPVEYAPDWAGEDTTGDPGRDLDRLLDRFRDDIRDAARDHGVSESQLREARRHLSQAAAHIGAALRAPATEEAAES
ncbi:MULTISPECIES: PadR family transcriptional regulator [unclassified Streptomyces]|uniref:PadR family transcriptional regulator n=1 Tax=unclassified Streptomyces TaxID=2593676 RepID=UPI001371788D|nr:MULTISPECIES: PadR family transcriptional regulator [unclassified Streptomyces]NDZ99080.1 PadR family transcriptional regulator [Streptomyces sp. SID10116]MYY82706.1 PadR family transcriptional regulator [Streptomyces sp. SID335]MYZ14869.1 PadR family transcriptional regulator [Streptomyces sp. SID337]NDZ85896.1 PadR family transcriptional regulator [Streptomyces sp. SID10115]NEB44761.1 PadR family transcriptional regulator [Streptomyces sp. SID339]